MSDRLDEKLGTKFSGQHLALQDVQPSGTFTGYASVFNLVDAQNESVLPGAFTRSLREFKAAGRQPSMLWMHDPARPIGVWTDMREDARGLSVCGQLALRTQAGAEAFELMRLGALTGLSIGYRVRESLVKSTQRVRHLIDLELLEISLVTFPANEQARVGGLKSPLHTAPTSDDALAIIRRLEHAARVLTPSQSLTHHNL